MSWQSDTREPPYVNHSIRWQVLTTTKHLDTKTGKSYFQDPDNLSSLVLNNSSDFLSLSCSNSEKNNTVKSSEITTGILAWNSCYDKETLHVSHQRHYKILFKVKKTKVKWNKDCSNLRKISLRPQKVRKVAEKIAEAQFTIISQQ